MKTSPEGLALIRTFEGCSLKRYACPAGLQTIGYGHVIKPEDKIENSISPDKAEMLLRQDVATAEQGVLSAIHVPLTQYQFDALVSFTFNLGAGRLKDSMLATKINNGEAWRAASEFGHWIYAGKKPLAGLIKRRAEEALLFIKS